MRFNKTLSCLAAKAMALSRKGETICDSLFMTLGVFVPVVVSLYLYRSEPKKLLRIAFVFFLVLVAFILTRHTWARLANNVYRYFQRHPESQGERVEFSVIAPNHLLCNSPPGLHCVPPCFITPRHTPWRSVSKVKPGRRGDEQKRSCSQSAGTPRREGQSVQRSFQLLLS